MNNIDKLKEDIRKAAKRAYDIRLQSGDGGNLSARIAGEDLILIKASGCSFGDMCDENIIITDLDGIIIEGDRKPSREILTHLEIYRKRPDVLAVFHSHSPWSNALSQTCDVFPPVSLPLEMKIGTVPILDAGYSHADDDMAALVGTLIENNPGMKGFIQKRHGLFCFSTDIVKAEHDAELIEEAAQVAMLIKSC